MPFTRPSLRLVLILGMVLLAGCLLYPPWKLQMQGAFGLPPVVQPLGYSFLFSAKPEGTFSGILPGGRDATMEGSVDLTQLFIQVGAVAALTGVAFVALGWRRKP